MKESVDSENNFSQLLKTMTTDVMRQKYIVNDMITR